MVWLGIDGFSGFELSGEVELTLIEDGLMDRLVCCGLFVVFV